MIDPRILRDDPDAVRAAQRRRGESTDIVDELLAAELARRATISAFEAVRSEQKNLGKLIPKAQGDEKAQLLARTKELSQQVKDAEAAQNEAAESFDQLMKQLPNLASRMHPRVVRMTSS